MSIDDFYIHPAIIVLFVSILPMLLLCAVSACRKRSMNIRRRKEAETARRLQKDQ
ncbi:MAG: hypothetical protein RLZ98_1902 [Pseudomonadota bacterium]|jgi:hypothetical protein